ncbi:MAG: hypothetical protein LBJ72_04190 [Dysgonamonadaceae bacterium]|jgi:hypothetical protein|nr:hypothetical protein [Dysgonamonadaceae bacterium]
MNLFEETVRYIIHLNKNIEAMAENAHNMWRKKDAVTGEYLQDDGYETISEHFLAMMEHRRWMIEKYISFGIHAGLKPWQDIFDEDKMKNYTIVDLMINELNKQHQ